MSGKDSHLWDIHILDIVLIIKTRIKGGIQEQFDLKKLEQSVASNFWEIICKGFEKNSIMGCSINVRFMF